MSKMSHYTAAKGVDTPPDCPYIANIGRVQSGAGASHSRISVCRPDRTQGNGPLAGTPDDAGGHNPEDEDEIVNMAPLFLSRIQFAVTVSFHILFPSITVGLSVWLALLQGLFMATGRDLYRRLFDFWLKLFALLFALGVVTGIVLAFQFGTNWSVLSAKAGPILGPLLGYEAITAFMLEATFLGVLLYGRSRVSPGFYFFSCLMIAFGTVLSSFWILCNNSWMQVPVGYKIVEGRIIPVDWQAIVLRPVFLNHWVHMLLASFLTTSLSIAAAGAWYTLRKVHLAEAGLLLRWGLRITTVLIVAQIVVGDLSGKDLYRYQPAKFAAIEARWQPEEPGREVWLALPDVEARKNRWSIESPYVGSWIATGNWTAPVSGLSDFPRRDWPPILTIFFAFRIMVGLGVAILALGVVGLWLDRRRRLDEARWFLWCTALAFPAGFLAVIVGWITTEVGRQPWAVYGLLRTAEAVTPTLGTTEVLVTLAGYTVVYSLLALFGGRYLLGIVRRGPAGGASPKE